MEKYMNKLRNPKITKTHIFLIIFAIIATLWRLYPHLFLIPNIFPDDEHITINYVTWLVNHNGHSANPLYMPHLEFYLAYIIHFFVGGDPIRLCFFLNPIIGGISVFAFYYLSTVVLDEKKALWASGLFAVSEVHFYRSCHFSSTEALGFLFLLLFLGTYFREKYKYALPLLALILFSHTLPFIISMLTMGIHILIYKGKKIISLVSFVFLAIIILSSGLHPTQTIEAFLETTSSISLTNIFIYDLKEIVSFIPAYSGIIIISLYSLFKPKDEISKILFLISITGGILSLICYYSGAIGPTRFLLYLAIPSILVFTKNIERMSIMLLISGIMISGPLVAGLDKINWVNYAITEDEIEAINWASEQGYFTRSNDPTFNYTKCGDWFFDSTINKYVLMFWRSWMSHNSFVNYKTEFDRELRIPCYVLISERMKSGAFIQDRYENGTRLKRCKVLCVPVRDKWRDDPDFKVIYDKNGVRIYKNVYHENMRKIYGVGWRDEY